MNILIGAVALVLFFLNFISQFLLFVKGNIEGGRWSAIEAALYLIVVAICFH